MHSCRWDVRAYCDNFKTEGEEQVMTGCWHKDMAQKLFLWVQYIASLSSFSNLCTTVWSSTNPTSKVTLFGCQKMWVKSQIFQTSNIYVRLDGVPVKFWSFCRLWGLLGVAGICFWRLAISTSTVRSHQARVARYCGNEVWVPTKQSSVFSTPASKKLIHIKSFKFAPWLEVSSSHSAENISERFPCTIANSTWST
jgi:hypothetical protein